MNTIFVECSCNPVGYVAEVDIIPFGVARIHASSLESYVEAIAELRRGLAYLGYTGRMELSFLPSFFDDEEQIDAALALPDEELALTPEYIRWIVEREESEAADPETGREGENPSDLTSSSA
jgi:hypothetical protein